ncbi:hypothetical protein NVP2095A_62 [Vibrio phage 2.095.A._10N.286.46.E10]|nr:hypothetical protein NVP2095A_62 [Vibrio phage 2.095.A._10N.286.46.E10]AUS02220.1 hypothetical protein NVP2095B_62 [Vibrio phage 2.095.B._10N.286.46.E10]
MSLKQAAREALKGNDVEVHAKLYALRIECRERGIDSDKVTEIIKSVIHEDKQPEAVPEPPAPEPITPEPPKAVQDRRTDKELSRRSQFTGEPVKQRKDSDSMILMMADSKKA